MNPHTKLLTRLEFCCVAESGKQFTETKTGLRDPNVFIEKEKFRHVVIEKKLYFIICVSTSIWTVHKNRGTRSDIFEWMKEMLASTHWRWRFCKI